MNEKDQKQKLDAIIIWKKGRLNTSLCFHCH